jgi:hypothetical protein
LSCSKTKWQRTDRASFFICNHYYQDLLVLSLLMRLIWQVCNLYPRRKSASRQTADRNMRKILSRLIMTSIQKKGKCVWRQYVLTIPLVNVNYACFHYYYVSYLLTNFFFLLSLSLSSHSIVGNKTFLHWYMWNYYLSRIRKMI